MVIYSIRTHSFVLINYHYSLATIPLRFKGTASCMSKQLSAVQVNQTHMVYNHTWAGGVDVCGREDGALPMPPNRSMMSPPPPPIPMLGIAGAADGAGAE